jgi:hypothetical protein
MSHAKDNQLKLSTEHRMVLADTETEFSEFRMRSMAKDVMGQWTPDDQHTIGRNH